jgi:spore coat protein U-like protein
MKFSRLVAIITVFLAIGTATARAEVCSITSVTGVAFGAYDVFDPSPVSSAGAVTYVCTAVQPLDRVVIELDGVTDAATLRAMTAGSHTLGYQLYLDAARTLVWGTGGGGTASYGPILPSDGVSTVVPIYGALPARQDVATGSYGGTVVVTLQF